MTDEHDGDFVVSWSEDGELSLVFYNEETGVQEEYFFSEETSYELYLFLKKKFRNILQISKDPGKSADNTNNEEN